MKASYFIHPFKDGLKPEREQSKRDKRQPRMNADERGWEEGGVDELTENVIRCALMVSNMLGCGFLEKVYENALAHELRKAEA